MNAHEFSFGVLLRRWRQRRRMTQFDLAAAANSSTRHLSYLEIGRAKPSREMVARLAESLDIPLRERNTLLLSAGFAPAFQERPLADLASVHQALERVIEAHKPYPAFAVDRHWDIVLSNRVLPQLYVDVSTELLRPPVNAIRLMLHPRGMAPRIVNLGEWRAYIITMLRQQVEASSDPGVQSLLTEIIGYPAPMGGAAAAMEDGAHSYATPLQIATDAGTVSFLNTVTVFGTPTDVTLSELALEMLFAADADTVAIVAKLTAQEMAAAVRGSRLVTVR
jgi:transcriptional regulator with XRE-family HTH domain